MPTRTYITNRSTQKKYRLNGVKPSNRMPHKPELSKIFSDHIHLKREQLPPKVDLRSQMAPIEDQSKTGSCTANSLAGAYEYLVKKNNGRDIDVSRLFIYYNGRKIDKKSTTTITDSGLSLTNAIEALEESGACLESLWPYDILHVNTCPSSEAYAEAKEHRITGALQVKIDFFEMKACLAQGFPFTFGLRLYKSFNKAAKTGAVPLPDENEQRHSKKHASHAMLAVGYSDKSRAFIVRNSWGESWGDRGYCYIPYGYMTSSTYCFDAWAIQKLETDDMGHENWDNEDAIDYRDDDDIDEDYDNDDDEIEDEYEEGDDNGSEANDSSSD